MTRLVSSCRPVENVRCSDVITATILVEDGEPYSSSSRLHSVKGSNVLSWNKRNYQLLRGPSLENISYELPASITFQASLKRVISKSCGSNALLVHSTN